MAQHTEASLSHTQARALDLAKMQARPVCQSYRMMHCGTGCS